MMSCFVVKNSFSQSINKADSLGLPGDNLNLYSVLDLFQQCATFEEFEKKLNQEDSKINNLDLNNDSKTDYIKVIDNKNGDNHAVVLQVPVNEKENQDVAVIEIEKDKDGKYMVQIVGNEDLYGKDYIVEPKENDSNEKQVTETPIPKSRDENISSSDGKTVIINNNTTNNYSTPNNRVYVSVGYWPIVRHIYSPVYVVYVSPWYWHYYPTWWSPWNTWYWHRYYWHHHHYHNHYYGHYHRAPIYRNPNTHTFYGQRKSSSMLVSENRTKGTYIKTYDSPNKGKPVTTNPAFKPTKTDTKPVLKPNNGKPVNSNIKTEPKTNYNKVEPKSNGKPQMKPTDNTPKQKPNMMKPQSKPNSPAVKPQQRPNNSKPQQQSQGPRKK